MHMRVCVPLCSCECMCTHAHRCSGVGLVRLVCAEPCLQEGGGPVLGSPGEWVSGACLQVS